MISVTQEEDLEGKVGVALSKDSMAVAGDALNTNITTLGASYVRIGLFFATLIRKKLLKMKLNPCIPDCNLAFEQFCIHTGRVKREDTMWQIAFSSGFKCNSADWRVLRGVNPEKELK
ncbi:3-ketoacyl-CoA synthase 11-like [Chenopodium quinoa]|uniref:3-ketoacyl-CoA synthase 11-like n=1 Tax=Chenopodium quinoa TaxID=63459 RepID=UPI000B787030|nr:3-ketoacyl-CoA synthase 11-like [Chenopodium quinoa]